HIKSSDTPLSSFFFLLSPTSSILFRSYLSQSFIVQLAWLCTFFTALTALFNPIRYFCEIVFPVSAVSRERLYSTAAPDCSVRRFDPHQLLGPRFLYLSSLYIYIYIYILATN